MPHYTPPLRDMQFVMHELLDAAGVLKTLPRHAEVNRELMDQVMEEGGKFCAEELLPINLVGDVEGCKLSADGVVTTPKGFKQAYAKFVEGGWPGLACADTWGGQGLPHVMQTTMQEMMNATNQAWTMYPGLTHGAYAAIAHHGSDTLKARYLPMLVSGRWLGTMCLTEPHCGTDLGMLRSRAEPQADGSFRLTGTKIFISAGEHDLTENIIHLVLARLPDAPAGVKGISLFLVPKFIPNADNSLGPRNGIKCTRLENKMGIHGSATCEMTIEGAAGWMVGEPNRGLAAMFVMMNAARLGVGMQSLGLMEMAYQNSVAYARDRIQSRSLTGPKAPDKPADPIIVHPDVRRMLLTQRAYTEGCRALAYWVSLMIDEYENHPDADERKRIEAMVALLTPIVKAFLTDAGFECTSLGMQVFGGHGYIRENGMEQLVRDARINMIYEGTNTIQSLDLLGRKVLQNNGATLKAFGKLVYDLIEKEGTREDMAEFINPLADLGQKLEKLTTEIGMKAFGNQDEAGAAAVPYLRVVGHLVLSYLWARMARIALDKQNSGDDFYKAKLITARFYFAKLQPETASLIRVARSGAAPIMAMEEALF